MNLELIRIEKNKEYGLVVSSRIIAEELGKRHSNVIRDLENILNSSTNSNLSSSNNLTNGDFRSLIILNNYVDKKGETRKEYLLTKDGFILYMFNIQDYNDFKMAYINRFNEMEKIIKENQKVIPQMSIQDVLIATLEEQKKMEHRIDVVENKVDNEIRIDQSEQRKLQKAIGTRVFQRLDVIKAEKNLMFPAIHRDLKDRFGVASYRDIKRKDLTEALGYVSNWIERAELRK